MNISKKIIEKITNQMYFDFNEFNTGLYKICPNLELTPETLWHMSTEELMQLMEDNMYERFHGITYDGHHRMSEDVTGDIIGDLYGPFEIAVGVDQPEGITNRELHYRRINRRN